MSLAVYAPSPEIDDATRPNEPVPASNTGGDRSVTVLIAEDDSTVRDFVVLVLREQGYRVLLAENGSQALEECRGYAGAIDALITDAVMPLMNGRELAEQVRRIRPGIKVLLISGYVDRGFRNEDASNPANAFLGKPFTEESLVAAIQRLCPSVCSA